MVVFGVSACYLFVTLIKYEYGCLKKFVGAALRIAQTFSKPHIALHWLGTL